MPRLVSTILPAFSIAVLMMLPLLNAGNRQRVSPDENSIPAINLIDSAQYIPDTEMTMIYDSLELEKYGLKKEAFNYAYTGYKKLQEQGTLEKEGILTICDFSQSSKRKRLYLVDLNKYKLLLNTYVAHGRNSGAEYARKFSNRPESKQSSLGFYKTKKTYYGSHGLALTLAGLEAGINDKAERRKIVVHGSAYIGESYLRRSRYMGRSFGCPAVPKKYSARLINTIKGGSCLFIYHPGKNYLAVSKILNG